MSKPSSISPAIVDSLYEEALLLADEARSVFDMSRRVEDILVQQGPARIALSCEALRTTTRMMHAIAWLLNHRAFFKGELSEFQLRRHGRLPSAQPEGDEAQMALLDLYTLDIVDRTRAFYARLARLDTAWREAFAMQPKAVERLRQRLDTAFEFPSAQRERSAPRVFTLKP